MTAQRPQRVIAKFGTNLLTAGGDRLDALVLEDLVRQVAELRAGSAEVAIVTSGAVAAGRARVGARSDQTSIGQRQALAAIGQAHLVERYDQLLQRHDLTAAQALITRADVAERLGYLNVRNTLLRLLRFGVVPIINENDVVADEELRGGSFGENDALSALVANLIDADLLILLSDVDGVYDRDPRIHADATLLRELPRPGDMLAIAGAVGERGRGGMRAKLEAAQLAASSGTTVVIANGREPDAIVRIAGGEQIGTCVPAAASVRESRKRWLLAGLGDGGALVLDAGAAPRHQRSRPQPPARRHRRRPRPLRARRHRRPARSRGRADRRRPQQLRRRRHRAHPRPELNHDRSHARLRLRQRGRPPQQPRALLILPACGMLPRRRPRYRWRVPDRRIRSPHA